MFDLRDPTTTRILPASGVGPEADMPVEDKETGLDGEDMVALHGTLRGYYRQELDRQSENRTQMAIDEDYYDNIQWTDVEAAELRKRGQAPLVYNVIAQSINWIIGSEKRGRTDFKVLPRRADASKPAEKKSDLLKYLSDVNRLPFHRSRAFEDTVKVGLGWMEDALQDEDDGEPIYSRYESWRNILHDSTSTELDNSDGRYIFRAKWLDLDISEAMFPDRVDQLRASADKGSLYSIRGFDDGDDAMDSIEFANDSLAGIYVNDGQQRRQRVRIIECWYRAPEVVKKITGRSDFKGEIFDPNDPRHQADLDAGVASLGEKPMMRMRVAIFTHQFMLWEGPSPYRHNRFPFTPCWGFRRGRDNLPYGIIRWMRDIQDDINKKASKAQHILSTNKTIMDEGAVDDIDAFAEEVSRPDAIIVKKPGKHLEIGVDRDLAPAHMELMSNSIRMVQQIGGVTDELLGRSTNAVSGVAIQARQEQGSVATNKLFDNLRLFSQMQGEIQLSLIEQFMTDEKQFRITNARGVPAFVDINTGLPEDDITRSKADFIISESEWRASMRQAAVEQLMQLLSKMPPEVAMVVLDLLVDAMDIPNREEIVKRIRQMTNQRDPDATEPTPEEIQAAAAAQEQSRRDEALFQANLSVTQSKAMKGYADAQITLRKLASESVGAQKAAFETAILLLQQPQAAIVADTVLETAGYEQSMQAPPPMGLAPEPPPQPEPMQDAAQATGGVAEEVPLDPRGQAMTPDQTIVS